jgi:hypothetical protein
MEICLAAKPGRADVDKNKHSTVVDLMSRDGATV